MTRTLPLVLAVIALAAFFSCTEERPAKKFKIGFSQCCDDAWRDVMNREMHRELALHPELEFEMRVAAENSQRQLEQIRELAKSGIDLLIVAPNESRPLTAVLDEVFQSGIPVIMIDRKTESEQYTAYIGADNFEIGSTAAHYIATQVGGKGKIIEIQMSMTISPAVGRNQGFRSGLRAYPGLEVVDTLEVPLEPEFMNDRLPAILQRHPDARIIFGHTDVLAETAYKIADKQGIARQMFFVGIDGIPGTGKGIEAVEAGILDASLLYPTGGAEAIKLALAILNGLPYERRTLLQTTVITPENASILHAQMKKEASLQESIDKQIQGLKELKSIYRDQKNYIAILISSLFVSLLLGAFWLRSLRATQAANKSLEQKNREVLEHEQQIVEMSDELRRATQAKVDFFTNISHEFRTPLTLILGFTDDVSPSGKLDPDTRQNLGFIKQNAYRLLRLVNQLMDFRKIESDGMKLRASENDLVAFVRNTMQSYGKVAQKRGIDFQLITRHEQLLLWFDPGMMDKVLFNLLSNAFKFTPDGAKIHLSISVDGFENKVRLRVEDSGLGMTAEETTHVFEAFYQGDEGRRSGTGLGLSLSKKLVELHEGDLSVSSIKGKGSRFTVTLPLGHAHLRDDQRVVGETDNPFPATEFLFEPDDDDLALATPMAQSLPDQHLLLIEDNADVQFFLKRKLGARYQMTTASDGDSGLQSAFDHIPDLILCDIRLPGRDGLDVVRTLKSDLRTSHIPVILLTAQTSVEQQIEGARAGADVYITKPFNIHHLQENIRNLLHNRQLLKDNYGKALLSLPEGAAFEALPGAPGSLDQEFIRRFTRYVETHFDRQDFQVTDLCRELNLSRSQLYRKVKALLGESISDYIQTVRLEKARALLLEGQLSVAEIAYRVGYSSPDYFSTVFRSKYNVAPTQFRRQG